MTKRRPPDVEAVNPRYRGAKMSDVGRALLLSRNPDIRAAQLAKWAKECRSVTPEKAAE